MLARESEREYPHTGMYQTTGAVEIIDGAEQSGGQSLGQQWHHLLCFLA